MAGPSTSHHTVTTLTSHILVPLPGSWLLLISGQERRGEEEKRGCFVTGNPGHGATSATRHVPPLAHIPGPRGTMGSGRSSVLLLTLLLGGLL